MRHKVATPLKAKPLSVSLKPEMVAFARKRAFTKNRTLSGYIQDLIQSDRMASKAAVCAALLILVGVCVLWAESRTSAAPSSFSPASFAMAQAK